MKKKTYRTPAVEVVYIEEKLLVGVSTNTGLRDGGAGNGEVGRSREGSHWDDNDE